MGVLKPPLFCPQLAIKESAKMQDLDRLIQIIEDSKLWVQQGGNLGLTELLEVYSTIQPHISPTKIENELQRAAITQLLQAQITLIRAYRSEAVSIKLASKFKDLLSGQI